MIQKILAVGSLILLMTAYGCKMDEQQSPLTGLWEVTKVTVDEQEMTPRAKWSRLNEDGTFKTGNGWLQNSAGTWSFDVRESTLQTTIVDGFEDAFGPFEVDISSDSTMNWQREEEGQEVTVFYQRIAEIPKNLPDVAVGIWDLKSAEIDGQDMLSKYDPDGNRFVFLRWDQLFMDFTHKGQISGIWRIDAHRPALDILFYDDSKSHDYWSISFNGNNRMHWSSDEIQLTFSRLTAFPE